MKCHMLIFGLEVAEVRMSKLEVKILTWEGLSDINLSEYVTIYFQISEKPRFLRFSVFKY